MLKMPIFEDLKPIDWDDFLPTAEITQKLLRSIAADKKLLTELVYSAIEDPFLFSKCETDVVEDKIVLFEDMSKGFRLRLRMATAKQEELAHQHRFSFTTLVLRGSYLHRTYLLDRPFDESARAEDFRTVYVHEDGPGTAFTIDHEAIHSTPLATADTIVLVLRGPAKKDAAPVVFREDRSGYETLLTEALPGTYEPTVAKKGDMFWRVGEGSESEARRKERQMSPQLFWSWCDRLTEQGIINAAPALFKR